MANMNVEEIEKELSLYVEDSKLSSNPPSVFCINCRTISCNIITLKDDFRNHNFYDNSFYRKAALSLKRKFEPKMVRTNYTWFCTVKCLSEMICKEQDYILEEITK